MIVGVWRSAARALGDPLASQVAALLNTPGALRVDRAFAHLAVWSPAHIEQRDDTSTAWAASGAGGRAPIGHPSVRLEGDVLVIAAPPLPQYPLYYVRAFDDAYLFVSSRLEPLARLLLHTPVNVQRVACIIDWPAGTVDPDRGGTVYVGIRRLLPSEKLIAGPEGVRAERSVPRIGQCYRQERVADLAVELRDRLDAAVGRAMGDSARVAVLVSGGLDSSGLLALAAARCRGATPRELLAVSLQFKGPGDDRPYFAQLVEALGVTPVRLSASDAGKWFRASLCSDAQPGCGRSGTCLEMLFYATVANLRADVALCGSLGDGICGGPLPFAQLAKRGHPLAALEGALRIRLPWSMTPWDRVRSLVLRPLLPKAVLRARRRRRDHPPWMTPRLRAVIGRCRDAPERASRPLPDTPDEWMEELCEGNGYVLPDIADVGGQASAVTGGAPLDAFMDFDFVRFMLEIDPVLLSHGDEYRGLYRLAMTNVLPEPIRTRQDKAGFEPAIAAAALAANAVELLTELSSLDALATRGLVDPAPFRPVFNRWLGALRRGERDDSDPGDECWQEVWQLLSVEAFLRQHGQGRDLA